MVAKPVSSKSRVNFGWRAVVVCLLTIVGLVAATGFTLAHWTERQVLTTDNWIKVVGPLPKNNQVSSALSTYSVNKLFTETDLENRISDALPDKASFLAPTITDQLETRLTKRTKQLIESDQFTTIWTTANKAAHQRLLASARGETPTTAKTTARFNLNLSAIKDSVSSFLNQHASATDAAATAPNDNSVGLSVTLKTSLDKLKQWIRAVDFLNGTLGLLGLVCLIGALVITYHRRRLVIVISLSLLTIALLQLIGVKALRPAILNQIQDSSFRPAVGVVYDTLVLSFKNSSTSLFFGSLIVFLVALLTQSKLINRSKYLAKQLKHYKKTAFYDWWQQARQAIRSYLWQICLGAVLLGLVIMAFALGSFSWQTLIRSILFIILFVELINLVAARSGVVPMKQ